LLHRLSGLAVQRIGTQQSMQAIRKSGLPQTRIEQDGRRTHLFFFEDQPVLLSALIYRSINRINQ